MKSKSNLDLVKLATNQKIKLKTYWSNRLKNFQLNTYFKGQQQLESGVDSDSFSFAEYKTPFPESLVRKIEKMSPAILGKQIISLSSLSILANKYSSENDIGIFSPLSVVNERQQVNSDDFVLSRFSEFEELDFSNFLQKVKNRLLNDLQYNRYNIQHRFEGEIPELSTVPKVGLVIAERDVDVQHEGMNIHLLFVLLVDCRWTLSIKYKKMEFDSNYIQTLAKRYFYITEKLIDQPNVIISNLELATSEEKNQILFEFNKKPSKTPFNGSVMSLFELQVKKHPENVAVTCSQFSLSYRELSALVNQFARFLKKRLDIKPKDLIGIELEQGVWTLVSILSVFKLGAAYVPIDTDFPKARKDYILHSGKINYLINEELIVLFKENQMDFSKRNFRSSIQPKNLAYVIFTSGSTGQPKGAMITHGGMLNHLLAMKKELGLNARSKVSQTAPFTFDISVWQFLNALIVGGETIVYTKDVMMNMELFLKQLHADQVTILQIVPSYFGLLVDSLKENRHQYQFTFLKYMIVTGEEISHGLLKTWFELYPNKVVVNAYGPAEASDDVTLHFIDSLPFSYNIPVGKPIMNTRVYILDHVRNLCPIGIIGEIYVSGICVGEGYLNEEVKTEQSFSIDPFFKDEHTKMYKTGDFGRWLCDGTLEFCGRKDDQIKINGRRIELREIEFQMALHPMVEQSVVLLKRVGTEDLLVAYYTTMDGIRLTSLREFLGDKMPKYMVPTHIVHLIGFPLNSNGKVDKKALSLPGEFNSGSSVQGPVTMTEEILVDIWAEILNLDKSEICTSKSFFELGGQSLKVMVLVNKISKHFDVNITIPVFFSNPTIKEISRLVEDDLFMIKENLKTDGNKTDVII